MKKTVCLVLLFSLLLPLLQLFSGCSRGGYELVLVTDSGGINDRGYNQSCWEAMTEFAIERDLDCRYFIPSAQTHDALVTQLRAAAGDGARVIVAPGKCFETAVFTVQREYPDVKFIIVDGKPHPDDTMVDDIKNNTAALTYASEQAGFIAGYAAVCDGMTKLGFIGGEPDEDVRSYGFGFLQGVNRAAGTLNAGVEVFYRYTGDFENNDKNKQSAAEMYENGVDVIFACGGRLESAVMEAAAEKRGLVICSDVDRRYDSTTVLTSAVKGVAASVSRVLRSIYDTKDFDESYGGKAVRFDCSNGGAGLASYVINDENGDAFDRFNTFTKADYEAVLSSLNGSITVKRAPANNDPANQTDAEYLSNELGLSNITLNMV